jgi:hypothetical protein
MDADRFAALIGEALARAEEARVLVYQGPLPSGTTTAFHGASLNRLDEAIYQLRRVADPSL